MAGPTTRSIAVGAFVVSGFLLFSIGLFLIGTRRMLFGEHFEVRAEFARIAGLQVGATVRVAGMNAGEVKEIHVPSGPSAHFLVVMQVRSDLHPVVRTDSAASIQNEGLVGNKFVQIEAGSDAAPQVADKGTIKGVEPFDLADLMNKMSDTIDNVNATIDGVQGELNDALSAVTETAQATQDLVNDVSSDVRAIATSGQRITTNLSSIIADVKAGRGTVGKLMTDETLYTQIKDISQQAQKAVTNLREASDQAKQALTELRGDGGPMKGVTSELSQTLTYARDAMEDLADNTEALKHNFLFRGFFNKRGYFDLDEITVQQYRAGALETNHRVPLRIWLNSGVLFTTDAGGREVLTEDGRRRIDSAMSQFVQYPRTSPLIVEGYATGGTGDERYLLSRSRGQLVRDYVVGRFGLEPKSVGIMPMGSEAPNSPMHGTWDGVALTIFVPKAALVETKPVAQGLIEKK
jgi:phospholipid/cholesterol/gamma-HCH transport system substrate-binding protein